MCRRWRYYRSSVSCPETPWHVEVDWESNRQPFGSYTTALPTEPQPFKKKTALLSQDEANQVRDNKRKHLHHKGWVLHSCLKNLRLFLSPQRNSLKWCSKPWTTWTNHWQNSRLPDALKNISTNSALRRIDFPEEDLSILYEHKMFYCSKSLWKTRCGVVFFSPGSSLTVCSICCAG